METRLHSVDKHQLRRAFEKAALTYDKGAILQQEIGRRMLARLEFIKFKPHIILDLGAGTGQSTKALLKCYRGASVIALDIATTMLKQTRQRCGWFRRPALVCADAEALPLAQAKIDLLYSNLTLQWCNDLNETFKQFRRVIRPGGLVMFSTFGPSTLKELRLSWSMVDDSVHVHDFVDMHDIGDALVHAGFSDPVMDMELITLTYDSVKDITQDLKLIGAQNKNLDRARGLLGKGKYQQFVTAYEQFRTSDGKLPASYEVIYGQAWVPKSEYPTKQRGFGGEIHIPLDQINRHINSSRVKKCDFTVPSPHFSPGGLDD